MANDSKTLHESDQLHAYGPPPAELLDSPLDYVFAEHFRQRTVCAALKRIAAERRVLKRVADSITAFFAVDLAIHHEDEEYDLFPAMKLRARPEDDLDAILHRLTADHRALAPLIEDIVPALTAAPSGDVIDIGEATADRMSSYVLREQKHLSVENSIVLVIARKRLTRGDLARISKSMKARRGLVH